MNELLNLKLKTMMIFRRTSTQSPDALFRRAALTATYDADLQAVLEKVVGEHTNQRHRDKDASKDVYRLAYELYKTGSTKKADSGRDSGFKPVDILHKSIGDPLYEKIEKFNNSQCLDGYFDDSNTISIDDLVDILDEDGDVGIDLQLYE